jgi:hypothetical protein
MSQLFKVFKLKLLDIYIYIYIYIKNKQYLNTELYHTNLKATQEWNGTWHLVSNHIHMIANKEANTKYDHPQKTGNTHYATNKLSNFLQLLLLYFILLSFII